MTKKMLSLILSSVMALSLTGCLNFDRDSKTNPGHKDNADAGIPAKVEITQGLDQIVPDGNVVSFALKVKDKYNAPASYGQIKISSPNDPSYEVIVDTNEVGENLQADLTTLNATGMVELVFTPVSNLGQVQSLTAKVLILTAPTDLTLNVASTGQVGSDLQVSGSLKDSNGFPLPNKSITFTSNQGTFLNLPPSATTDAQGNFTLTLELGSLVGGYVLKASVGGLTKTSNISATVAPLAFVSVFSGNNQALTAGIQASPVKVRLMDTFGNPHIGTLVSWGATSLTTDSAGEVSFTFPVKTIAGTFQESISVGSILRDVNYTVSPASPSSLAIVSGANQVKPRGEAFNALETVLKDAYGNTIPNASVSYDYGSTVSKTTNSLGLTSFAFPGTSLGVYPITVSSGSLSVSTTFTIKDYSPLSFSISSSDLLESSEIIVVPSGSITNGSFSNSISTTSALAVGAYAYNNTATDTTTSASPSVSSQTATVVDITNPNDLISISPSITLPVGVSSVDCSVSSPSLMGSVACLAHQSFTILRSQLKNGLLKLKALSVGFGVHDYLVSNGLDVRTVKVKSFTRASVCSAGVNTDRQFFVNNQGLYFRDCGAGRSSLLNLTTGSTISATYDFAGSSVGTVQNGFFHDDKLFFQVPDGTQGGYVVVDQSLHTSLTKFIFGGTNEDPYVRGGTFYAFDGTNSRCGTAQGLCPFNSFKGILLFSDGTGSFILERTGIYYQTGSNRALVFSLAEANTSFILDGTNNSFKGSISSVASGSFITQYDLGLYLPTDGTKDTIVSFKNVSNGSLTYQVSLPASPGFTINTNACNGANVAKNASCNTRVRFNPSGLSAGTYTATLTTTRGNTFTFKATISDDALNGLPQKITANETEGRAYFTYGLGFFDLDAVNGTLTNYPMDLGEDLSSGIINKVWDLDTEVWINKYNSSTSKFELLSFNKDTKAFKVFPNLNKVDFITKYHDHYYFAVENSLVRYKEGVFTKVLGERPSGNGQVFNQKLYFSTKTSLVEICDPDLTTCN